MGPRCAVGVTRQSALGTWAVVRLMWVLAAQGARQFAGCPLLFGRADWPVGLRAAPLPGQILDMPRLASWRVTLA